MMAGWDSFTSWNLPFLHCTVQVLGLPFRIFWRSTCQVGNPIPGRPSSIELGSGFIFHLATQELGVRDLGLLRRINPVVLDCSTASWNLREWVKLSSGISPIMADREVHFSASSMAQSMSFSFFRSIKITWSGGMPKAFKAGGKRIGDLPIQTAAPPFFINPERRAEVKPAVEDAASALSLISS